MKPSFRSAPGGLMSLLVWACVASGQVQAAGNGPMVHRCNDNLLPQPALGGAVDDAIHATLTGTPLGPGDTVRTDGTNRRDSEELNGDVVLTKTTGFRFATSDGPAVGRVLQTVISDPVGFCKCHYQVVLASGCVSKLRFHHYVHPLELVADFRTDKPKGTQGGTVPSKQASRSIDGETIEFLLSRRVCADEGKRTRWLLLNTSVDHLQSADALELIAPDGSSSGLLSAFVPVP